MCDRLRKGDPAGNLVVGMVGSSSIGGQIWGCVAGLYSNIIADTQMSKDGTFQFEFPGGVYVVATRSGTRVVDTELLQCRIRNNKSAQ